MSGILELAEPLEVITPLGEGYAIILQPGAHDYLWTVVMDNGALVVFPQKKLRVKRNYSAHRGISDKEMLELIKPRRVRRATRK